MDQTVEVFLDAICCNGCGGCAELCPEVFTIVDETAVLKKEYGPQGCIEEAAVICPMDCIEVGRVIRQNEGRESCT